MSDYLLSRVPSSKQYWLFSDAKGLRRQGVRHDLATIHNEILSRCDEYPLQDAKLEEIDSRILKPSDIPEIRDPARQIAREIYCQSDTLEEALDTVHNPSLSPYDGIVERLSGPITHPLAQRF